MSLLDEFKWKNWKETWLGTVECAMCGRSCEGWVLETRIGALCMKCVASITTMHNLKADEIK